MIGGICGDIVGSRYEGSTMNPYDGELFHRDCDYTDDTVTLCATMDALSNNTNIEEALRSWCFRYPDRGYGGQFKRWLNSPEQGPYNSYGNGAGMRIGPLGLLSVSKLELLHRSIELTKVTHNHPEGIKGAQAIALACWLARNGYSTASIRSEITAQFNYDLSFSILELRERDVYEETCQVTVPIALTCALEASNFEQGMRNALYIGGDTDTIACMTGCICECLYGIPTKFIHNTLSMLPTEMSDLLECFYSPLGGWIVEPESSAALIEDVVLEDRLWFKILTYIAKPPQY